MSDQGPTPAQLEAEIARLTARVWTLEQTVAAIGAERAAPAPAHELPVYEPPPPAVEPPPAVAAPRPAAAQPRPVTPPAYTPPPSREPIDWGKVAARVFTARTLAWAGAVATVLGVVLLFVLAASRGWVTPPMRLGIGVVVSAALALGLVFAGPSGKLAHGITIGGVPVGGLYQTTGTVKVRLS